MLATLVSLWLLAGLSDEAVAVAGIANVWLTLGFSAVDGLAQSNAIVLAQHVRAVPSHKMASMYRLSLIISVALGILIAVGLVCRTSELMSVTGSSLDGLSGTAYLRIVAFGFPLYATNYTVLQILNINDRVRISMFNTIFTNWAMVAMTAWAVFCYSAEIPEKLFAVGCAQLLARSLGLAVNVLFCVQLIPGFSNIIRSAASWHLLFPTLQIFGGIICEIAAFQSYNFFLVRMTRSFGTSVLATRAYIVSISGVLEAPLSAFSKASQITVAQAIGRRDEKKARSELSTSILWAASATGAISLLCVVFKFRLFQAFSSNLEIISMGAGVTFAMAGLAILRSLTVHLMGALRASGDVRFVTFCTVLGLWLVSAPISFFVANRTEFFLRGVWVAMIVDEMLRLTALMWRWRNKNLVQSSLVEV
jgi:Na+-driven multidrug efflux pump